MRGERSYQARAETSLGPCDGRVQVDRDGEGSMGSMGSMGFQLEIRQEGEVTTLMRGGES